MAAILRTAPILLPCSKLSLQSTGAPKNLLSIRQRPIRPLKLKLSPFSYKPQRWPALIPSASSGDVVETEEVVEPEAQEDVGSEVALETGVDDGGIPEQEEKMASVVMATLQSYLEALANDDQSRIAEIEAFLLSLEEEKNSLAIKVSTFSKELEAERARILRISADFDNFRKRTERERLSLMENVRGEVLENLLPVLDNFERAKAQIKVETEGEEKINNSYQSISKQFMEILSSLGVETVETGGHPFDPLLHEAIMREESMEFEDGIIIQEFRKGFKLGDRLLRPSMVKVSAGPGPAKPEDAGTPAEEDGGETSQESTEEGGTPA